MTKVSFFKISKLLRRGRKRTRGIQRSKGRRKNWRRKRQRECRYPHISFLNCSSSTFSERSSLLLLKQQGWSSIGDTPLRLIVPERPTVLAEFHYRGIHTPFQVLRLFLTDHLILKSVIGPINSHLRIQYLKAKLEDRWRYAPLDMHQWWSFFGSYLCKCLLQCGNLSKYATDIAEAGRKCAISSKRYKTISAACAFGVAELEVLFDGMRKRIISVFHYGTLAVIDESIFEYRGEDMRQAGIDMCIERKPHPYGLMQYTLAQRLQHSQLPVVMDCSGGLLL